MTVRIGVPGVLITAELRARGMSPGALRHAVATGRLVRLRRGVYCDAEVWRSTANSPGERHAIEAYAGWWARSTGG